MQETQGDIIVVLILGVLCYIKEVNLGKLGIFNMT